MSCMEMAMRIAEEWRPNNHSWWSIVVPVTRSIIVRWVYIGCTVVRRWYRDGYRDDHRSRHGRRRSGGDGGSRTRIVLGIIFLTVVRGIGFTRPHLSLWRLTFPHIRRGGMASPEHHHHERADC